MSLVLNQVKRYLTKYQNDYLNPLAIFHRIYLKITLIIFFITFTLCVLCLDLVSYASPIDRNLGQKSTFSVLMTSKASGILELLHCVSIRRPVQNVLSNRKLYRGQLTDGPVII